MIREYTRQRRDEISEVIGTDQYAQNWYEAKLKAAVLGPHSCDNVPVSRYYFKTKPAIVVDFEPSPLDRKFYLEEKRKFFMGRGVAFVPVFLHERLTKEDFSKRLTEELEFLRTGERIKREDEALKSIPTNGLTAGIVKRLVAQGRIGELMDRPAFEEWLNAESLARVDREIEQGRNLRGAARTTVIAKTKAALVNELRKQALDVRLDRKRSAGEPAGAAQ